MSPYGRFLLEHCSVKTWVNGWLWVPWFWIKDNPFDNDVDLPKIKALADKLRIKIIWSA